MKCIFLLILGTILLIPTAGCQTQKEEPKKILDPTITENQITDFNISVAKIKGDVINIVASDNNSGNHKYLFIVGN